MTRRESALALALPAGVVDIDAEEMDNPQLCSEYAPVQLGLFNIIYLDLQVSDLNDD